MSIHINEVYVVTGLGFLALLFCAYVGWEMQYRHRPKRAKELKAQFFKGASIEQKLA